jgi:putative peptide zinc metalloprotease protein
VAVERPTFHESWYRVADLKPRLRASVQTYRQQYRGQTWHVVRDPASNRFFRLSEPAYHFVAMLDGRRTVGQVWTACNDVLGDASPTQGEVIQTLGQLYGSNLVQADLPADAAGLFERYRKRVRREVTGYMSNLLFVRIPLIDPERFLQRWVGVFGWLMGPIGFVLWLGLVGTAGYFLAGSTDELIAAGMDMITQQNLLLVENLIALYLCFAAIKVVHEFGHGFACKRFGRRDGSGGNVNTMGIMLLVFMPVPYVDASSSWAFRSKWQRAFVGAAGMYVEIAVAAVAAIVWANTGPGPVNAIAYNVILIASITTLLFNGNPLLRFDGYYILVDLLEAPNLYQRSKEYLYYLVKRYAYGVRRPRNPAHTAGERFWLPTYGVASFIYRIIICVGILLFVADKAFFVGALLALAAVITWVFVPLGKWVHYLGTSPQLLRTRGRAVAITVGVLGALVASVAAVPVADTQRAQGVVQPVDYAGIYMRESGFLRRALPTGQDVEPNQTSLVVATNTELAAEKRQLAARLREAAAQLRLAQTEDLAQAQALEQKIDALHEQLARVNQRLADLEVTSGVAGTWIAPDVDGMLGAYVERGQRLGAVASLDDLEIRVVADQHLGPRLQSESGPGDEVRIRVARRPDLALAGTVDRIYDAGSQELPSPALSSRAGGSVHVKPDDKRGATAIEPHFHICIVPQVDGEAAGPLHAGQRVVVRFSLPARPLVLQWWRSARQLLQRRFQI